MDRYEQEPAVLACGCPAQVVRDEGHQEGCRFEGHGPQDYPWIIEWCAFLGASVEVAKHLLDKARREQAPLDSFWFWLGEGEKRWITTDDMGVLLRSRLGLPPMPDEKGEQP